MSSIDHTSSAGDTPGATQESHPEDLITKSAIMKSATETVRLSTPVQLPSSQLRVGRIQNSSMQAVSGSNSGIQSGISAFTHTMLKTDVAVPSSVATVSPVLLAVTVGNARPSPSTVVQNTPRGALSMTTHSTATSTTYHVPRGPAAVANIAAPRSAVATPIVRATAALQTSSVQLSAGLRAAGRAPSPSWLGTQQQPTASRPSMTVTTRPVVTQANRLQAESPKPALKPTQTSTTQVHLPDKNFYKPSVSSGLVTIAQVVPARPSAPPPPSTFPATLIAAPSPRLTRLVSPAPQGSPQLRLTSPVATSTTRLLQTGTGVVSLQSVVVSNTSPSVVNKPVVHTPLVAGVRTVTTHQNLATKVLTQPTHGIQITHVPAKTPHGITPLQPTAVTSTRTITTATTTTTTVVTRPAPATSTQTAIPVAKVFPTAVGRSSSLELAPGEVALHTLQPQPPVSTASVFLQTSSPAPSPAPAPADRTLPTYTLPTTYYYETPSVYQVAGVGSPLVARPFGPYSVQTSAAPTLRPATPVHGIVTSGQTMRFNPVMVVDPTRSTVPLHSSFVTEGALVQQQQQQSQQQQEAQPPPPVSKPSASPRPSILRKRETDGSPMKAAKNLTPVLAALSSAPASPPSPRRPDSRGNGGHSSGGSTTISATSSPGLAEPQEEKAEEERPPPEMSPRKKPRKQQLTGNELHEPKFSEDEMEFISEEKIKKEIKEVGAEYEEKLFIPKRPSITLMSGYRHPWKSRVNHYMRYSDVRPKEERRPTLTELASQKLILQRIDGWKLYHLSSQLEKHTELEGEVCEKLSVMLEVMEKKSGKELDKEINRVNELIKGNMQRSKVIIDQMREAKAQMLKIFDHKPTVTEILGKCASKRSLKKDRKSDRS